ncbi:hypothetical protein KKI24_09170 [bacterium]|nr:hypothetical protein [bacterium]
MKKKTRGKSPNHHDEFLELDFSTKRRKTVLKMEEYDPESKLAKRSDRRDRGKVKIRADEWEDWE